MTKLFLDTNVMMDLLGERVPHYDSVAKIATLADKGIVKMVVSSFSYPTVYFLLSKFESSEKLGILLTTKNMQMSKGKYFIFLFMAHRLHTI